MAQVNYLEQTIDRAGSTIVDAVFLAQKQNFMIENNITDESELTPQQLARIVDDAKFATAFSVTLLEEYGSLSGRLTLAQLQQVELYKGIAGQSLGALATYIEAKPYLQNPDGTYSLANIARVIGSISLSVGIDVLGSKIAGAPGVAITNGANIALGSLYKKVVGPIYIAEFDEKIDKVTLKTADDLSTMLERHYESAFFGLIGEGLDEHARWEIIQDTTSGQKDALEYDSSVYHFKNHSWSEFDQPTNYFTSPLATLLQYLEVSNIRVKDNTTEKNILFNALSDAVELSVSSVRSDDKKFYALQELKPYVTSSDPYQNTYVPLYSDEYIKDRVNFLNRLIDGTGAYESIRYEDTELGIRTDDGTAPGGGAVVSVLFTDEDVMASNSTLAYHILGISLSETESIDKKEITKEVFLEEDFCSPLVLDLNGNGINSTRLNESSVYFDMDGDGFKERTAWVENGDGLLVLDKNANGVIDNGSELFGNFTQLADGNNADDGFSALLQHDENKDGKIDKNDAIYNQLNVWVDANQDGILNTQDEAFNYVLLREDDNGGVTLFIPQVDNQIKEAA